jgi:hypothetical protein
MHLAAVTVFHLGEVQLGFTVVSIFLLLYVIYMGNVGI